MATSNNLVLTAAHGITARTIATWNPNLPRTPRVMVPVQLDVMVMRQDGGTWADTRLKPVPPGTTKISRLALLPDPFSNLAGPRKKGAYLHWAMPDGLTHGSSSTIGSQADFPSLPDRWLVVRTFPAKDGTPRRSIRGWVLRANEDTPVVTDLDSWTEPGSKPWSKGPFNVMAGGDPAWTAYYDNVINRFGFYDDLSDITTGPIAYLVCGWYSDPLLDPLGSNIHSLQEFDSTLASLGWELDTGELDQSLAASTSRMKAFVNAGLVTPGMYTQRAPGISRAPQPINPPKLAGSSPAGLDPSGHPEGGSYQTNGAWWPTLTVYHGSTVAIGWPGVGFPGADSGLLGGNFGGPPPASAVNVALGNTLTEALSELVAKANNSPAEARVLEAFMLGALQELDQPDGAPRVDARLHATEFGALPDGEGTETITVPGSPVTPSLPAGAVTSAPGIFPHAGPKRAQGVQVLSGAQKAANPAASTGKFATKELMSEANIVNGGMREAIVGVRGGYQPAVDSGPQQLTVQRSNPRKFFPADPIFLLQGAGRTFKHGQDGRFADDGNLLCRLTGFCITELACTAATPVSPGGAPLGRPAISGDDVLQRGIENGSVPPECEDLLRELVLLDPGTAMHATKASVPALQGAQQLLQARNFMVEQTAWWAARDPRFDAGPLIAQSGLRGTLPSPVGVSPPVNPWAPLHLDWQVQYIPSPHLSDDWSLQETEYTPNAASLPAANDTKSGIILAGRALLTSGPAKNIASSVRVALKQAASAGGSEPLSPGQTIQYHSQFAMDLTTKLTALTVKGAAIAGGGGGGSNPVPAVDRGALQDIAGALDNMDVLAGALDNFHTRLRGGLRGDGVTTGPVPNPFIQMRAGFLRVLRLRLVDCFGQILDLAGSGPSSIANPSLISQTEPMQIANRPDIAALPPRFTSPTRITFRFVDAVGDVDDASATVSPVCGYVVPNHLDGDLEFFDATGANSGDVRPDPEAGILWETAPGQPTPVGASPAGSITNPFLAGMAQGLLDWGLTDATANREDALSAILRIIDSTLWSVDPFGHTGDEHLSLLVGHPIAVVRARLKLEVQEPVNVAAVNQMTVPLRLGALVHWQDGLLGYFVNDDYHTLYCADGAVAGFARPIGPGSGFLQAASQVGNYYQNFSGDLGVNVTEGATPVNHPYVNDAGVLMIQPDQEYKLTLLVEPHCVVHATTGLVPRKEIGLRREWISDALAKIAPTFRFGPVLVDPKRLRMPVPSDIHGSWSWDHRSDITTWAEDKVINATGDATLPDDAATGEEGWLRMTPQTDTPQGA